MRASTSLTWLSIVIIVLSLVTAGAGLFWQDAGSPYPFKTLRGQTVEIFGQGLYRYDTVFTAAGFKGQDTITIFLGIPTLLLTTILHRRGSLRGGLLLTGVLFYFLYVYATMATGAAYNRLFLAYVALFSASLFAFVIAFTSIDLTTLPADVANQLPSRGPAALMFAGGLITLFVWGNPLITGLIANEPVELLASYTTPVTYALDLALITPSCFVAGILLLRRDPMGYRLTFPLLGLIVMLVFVIPAMTIFQVRAGISFTPPELVGPVAGFLVLGLFAIWAIVAILRNIPEQPSLR